MDKIKAKNTTLSEQFQISIELSQKEVNKRQRTPKGQSKMDNPKKLTTNGTQDEEEEKTQCHMCWTPLCTNKHK